jgi:predicted oxidoreductase
MSRHIAVDKTESFNQTFTHIIKAFNKVVKQSQAGYLDSLLSPGVKIHRANF